jgi:hypothetical protein
MSLETVERMAEALPTSDQIRLIAHLNDILSLQDREQKNQSYKDRMLAALADCDEVAESIDGVFDSAADLNRIRNDQAAK